ncbi:ANK1 [Symbiodinium pilosum]|uniref:ANK1 protein n=1 Tax=Symbiodinium pilosum TaxID=2952 RepID=A0A812SC02_SYMPI|nr:ANK1 [Symbiodinium pilosum]
MSSLLQLRAIVEFMLQLDKMEGASKNKPAIIPVNLPEFQFPQAAYYENQLPAVWGDKDLEMAAEKIKSFFRFITINLPIHASDLLIETQCHEVLKRIPGDGYAMSREPSLQDLAGVIASKRSWLYAKSADERKEDACGLDMPRPEDVMMELTPLNEYNSEDTKVRL